MVQGAYDTLIIRNIHVNTFLQYFEQTLAEAQFHPKERQWFGYVLRGRSIWGDQGTAFVVSGFVPFGSAIKEGNRFGAEFEVYQSNQDVVLKLLIAPYMIIFDNRDIFLLSQGVIEHITDDGYCRNFLTEIVQRLQWKGLYVEACRGH
jgi:hypothetical protein